MDQAKERPAYIRFERRAIEDRAASLATGMARTKDVDFVIITPVGTKDEIPRAVAEWLPHLTVQVQQGRLPSTHEVYYKQAYETWKRGEEMPADGTPIKGWQVLSPAQQQNCVTANIRTVEDLAALNGEGATRIGMGAQEMKQKAETWLRASKEIGTVVQLNSVLQIENARLRATVADLEKKREELSNKLQALTPKAA